MRYRTPSVIASRVKPWILSVSVLFAIGLSANPAIGRIGDSFQKSRMDEFFRYVRFDTAIRIVNGEIITRPWGTLYKNRVEVRVRLSPDSNITSIEFLIDSVFLDSSWIRSRNMTANFIRLETSPEDSNLIADLANEIEYVQRFNLRYLGDTPKLPATPTDAYQVFLGKRESDDMPLKRSVLHIERLKRGDRPWLSIKISLQGLTEPRR